MSGLRELTGRLRNRKGATLVLIGIMMTVMIGMVGAGVDFARMYAFKAQLQIVADAGATAGALELLRGRNNANVPDTVRLFTQQNRVNGADTAFVPVANVEALAWDVPTRTPIPPVPRAWGDPAVNAVRVTALYTAPYTFGRIFGANTSALSGVAVAALGYVGATDCLKPWAVSYQTLLNALYPPSGPVGGTSYNLTPTDIATLAGMGASQQIPLLMNAGSTISNGNIQQVQVNNPWNGTSTYKSVITGPGCANMSIGPGTILNGDPGAGSGQTGNSLKDFCTANGGITMHGNDFTCNGSPKVKLVLWDWNNGLAGANLRVRVKYVGVFAITGFSKLPSNGEQINGYFSNLTTTSGGFSGTPSPLGGKVALVL